MSEFDNMTLEDLGPNFQYKKFDYSRDEFENVPPVLMRFLFYLQMNFVPINDHIRFANSLQTTESLRAETVQWVAEVKEIQAKQ